MDVDLHGNDLALRPYIGLGIGVAVRGGLGSRLSIESGLAYRLRGDRVEYRQYSFSPQILESYLPSEVRINVFSLPVLLNAHFNSGEAELRIAGGVEFAMNLSGQFEEGRDAQDGTGPTYDQTLISVFNRFDAGPTIGFGLDYPVRDAAIGIDIRGYYGLIDSISDIDPSRVKQVSVVLTYWINDQSRREQRPPPYIRGY